MNNLKIIQKFGLFPIIPMRIDKTPAVKWSDKDTWAYSEEDYQGKYPQYAQASAIVTGEASGVMVVDIDNKNGENGIEVFKEILSKLSEEAQDTIKNTLTVKTPNDGLHLYFKYREGLRNTAGVLPGIDLRTDGGIIIAPGSKIKKKDGTTGGYKVARGKIINEMPNELFELLQSKLKNTTTTNTVTTQYQKVDEGSRNQNLFSHLCKMVRTIKNEQELFSQAIMYNNTYFSKPLSEDEVRNTVNSVISYINQDGLKMDDYGIYKTFVKKDEDGNEQYVKKHITDFVITDAQIVRNIDTDEQVIKLSVKNNFDKECVVEGDARTLFNEIKNFRSALGIDYNFLANKVDDLIKLKRWIVTNCVSNDEISYLRTGIRDIGGEYALVTNAGILRKDGSWDTTIHATGKATHNIDFTGVEDITKEELLELLQRLLYFNEPAIVYNTIGLGIANMLNTFVRKSPKDNLPVLFIQGESNSGKSKAQHILRLLFNNTAGAQNFGSTSKYAIGYMLENSYLPIFVDEVKPSKDSGYKKNELGQIIRQVTEEYVNFKGTKDQKLKSYETNGSLMLFGEDGTDETAAVNRTNTVRFSRSSFTKEGQEAIEFLCQSSRGEELLRKLSKKLYLYVLNEFAEDGKVEEAYNSMYSEFQDEFDRLLDARIRNTAIYTAMGMAMLNAVAKSLGVSLERDLFIFISEVVATIVDNLISEVNDGNDTSIAEYEKILLDLDHLAGPVDTTVRLIEGTDYKKMGNGEIAFVIPRIWDKLEYYYKKYKTEKIPLSKNVFTKTLGKSKYYVDYKPVKYVVYEEAIDGSKHLAGSKAIKSYILLEKDLCDLGLTNILDISTDLRVIK